MISGRERGGGESQKRMREPSLPRRTTPRIRLQEPASARRRRKANPTCNRGGTLSRGLQPGTLAKTTGGRRKGHLTFEAHPLPTRKSGGRGEGCRRWRLWPRHHSRGATTVNRGSGQGPRLGWTSRRNPGKSTADAMSREQEQRAKPYSVCPEPSRAKEKGKKPKTRERQYKKRATSVTRTVDHTARRRESRRDRTRSPRAGEPGHPGSPGLTAQRASTPRSAMHTGGETLPDKTYKRTVSSPTRRWLRKTHKRMGSKRRPGSKIGKQSVSSPHSPTRGWAWPDRVGLKWTR